MASLLRKFMWWLQRRRKEDELRDELEFHLTEESGERHAAGLSADEAQWAARRDLGNVTLLQENTRALWSWILLEQLAQDIRYGLRAMFKSRVFTALAALSLALGIGANTAIYSFMDSILLRALPVSDPASLVVVKWQSKASSAAAGDPLVMHSSDGMTYPDGSTVTGAIFPFPALERLREASAPVLSGLFAHKPAGGLTVLIDGAAEMAGGEFVSGGFFGGLGVSTVSGRALLAADDRAGAEPVAVLSLAYSQRRFGDAASATGRKILVNNVPFTVVGVTPPEFFGVDPAAAPQIYLPMHASLLFGDSHAGPGAYVDQNYYWVEMMGRLQPGVDLARAQAALAPPFAQWVAATATTDRERANLPQLLLEEGAGGLDSLRRQYSTPLYVLLTMVGLILAIACANTANLLLARAAARRREMAVRLSLGAGRWRIVRQLLTESVLLAALSGALGTVIAVAGIRLLTVLLANGREGFTLHAELNWHVFGVTLALSLLCGVLFGLAPAIQSTHPALMPLLRDRSVTEARGRLRDRLPRVSLTRVLVVAQIAISLLLLVAAGLFVRTLSNLQSISLGFNRENVLLFELNAPRAGYPEDRVAALYADLRRRLTELPGVRDVTLSHASLIRAGRSHPTTVNGAAAPGTRILYTGPRFFTTMQIPLLRGREIAESDRQGAPPVAVVSDLFARANFGDADPVGRHIEVAGSMRVGGGPVVLEIVGVAASARYGGLKRQIPPVVYVPYAQVPAPALREMTYEVRTDGDPLRHVATVRQIVREADHRVPVTNVRTQAADIDQTMNQEIVFARLCSAFAILALVIACVGLYATMAYAVARRTNEIGLRMALGAGQGVVIWMVLREVCVLAAVGLAIGVPAALGTSRFIESFLFDMKPNDPSALALAAVILLMAAFAAGYGPARRASRVDPMIALRHE
jgi:macrolide transport system ATP-binding/permease protein